MEQGVASCHPSKQAYRASMNREIKLSKNGRITIPKDLRDKHGWTKGTTLEWAVKGDWVELAELPRKPSP